MFGYIYKKDAAIIAVVLCLCLGVGSFFDYQISSALFNIGSMYGRFIEAAGELPFELTASVAGVMLVRAVPPDSRGSKWLRDRFVPEGWRQTHRGSVGADVCAGHRRQPYRLSPHAHDRARRAYALGVDGACRVGRSGHHPQRDRQAAVVAPTHARDRGHAGAQFSAVVGNR